MAANSSAVELTVDQAELKTVLAELSAALAQRPDLADEVRHLLLGEGDCLQPGFVEFRGMSTPDAGRLPISLHVCDRLRELLAAVSAGEIERKAV